MTRANRYAYGEELARLAQTDKRIVVVDSDFGSSAGYDAFWTQFPDRYFNCGIAEQSMCSVAAGLSTCGLVPFVCSFAVFSSMRALDQVRNGIALYDLNVKVIGSHAGIETGMDGATHQSVEDIALMRSLPNMKILSPCCPNQTASLTRLVAGTPGTFYIRLGRDPNVSYYEPGEEFPLGGSRQLYEGDDVALLAHGRAVDFALEAAKTLSSLGVRARVLDMYSVKPLDKESVIRAARETKGIVVAEDHSIIGGLAGAVCELLCEEWPARVRRVGMQDCYGRSGKPADLFAHYGITTERIVQEAMMLL